MRSLRRFGIGSGLAMLLSAAGMLVAVPAAHAAHVSCGQTIASNTVLDSDVGPCSAGIRIGADNITFDLNHFSISGLPTPGDGPGILLSGHSGVTVKNGTVTLFDAGVSVEGGSTNNTVTGMRIIQNIGAPSTDYGDGILLAETGTTGNTVTTNVVRDNGPYDGIGVLGGASSNTITGNFLESNNEIFGTRTMQDDGIRIEGGGALNNVVTRNSVNTSGLDGIVVLRARPGNTGTVISGNVVKNNGFNSQNRQGHGIVLFGGAPSDINANNSTVQNNYVVGNASDGVRIESQNNQVVSNQASGNAVLDLRDTNAGCVTNTWHANQGVNVSPPCTLNP